jgi:hypothetical protein
VGQFCANTGDIPTTFYIGPNASDDCSAEGSLPAGIYILGAFENGNGDTDEFDQHVIAHEFGHYFEDRLSRSDSIGGSHGYVDRLDPRVAFSEAWGDAYAAMALNDPEYRDSISGVSSDGGFNLEHDETTAEGWFSEASIGEILWDIYDSIADGETVALGFTPIYSVMTNAQVSTDAVTSIFSFASALRSANPSSSSAIGSLLSGESISGSGAFGVGETNAGSSSTSLPIYTDITLNTPISICSSSTHGDDNKLGVHRFLKLVLGSSRSVSISATGAASGMGTIAAVDPDVWVNHQGTVTVRGEVTGAELFQAQLSAGTYILDVFDFDLMDTSSTRHCTNVSVAAQ